MIDTASRHPWRVTWRIATSDGVLMFLLLGIAAALAAATRLPQMPSDDPGAYARWLSEVQARFDGAASTIRALGLFTVARSFGLRALLALLSGCLSLRLVQRVDALWRGRRMIDPSGDWRELGSLDLPEFIDGMRGRCRVLGDSPLFQVDRWPWGDLPALLAHAGALLLLAGLLLSLRWGWQVADLVLQGGERTALRGGDKWARVDDDAAKVTHSRGLVAFIKERGPGVRIRAVDDRGRPLSLKRTARAEATTQLTMTLADDRYFAIPEAQMVFHLESRYDNPRSPVDVQIYRSPPGRLITEKVTEKGGSAQFTLEGVTVEFIRTPYARVTATFNPGRGLTAVGLVCLIVGIPGNVAWPGRRFWLREEEGTVEGTGALPSALVNAEGKRA